MNMNRNIQDSQYLMRISSGFIVCHENKMSLTGLVPVAVSILRTVPHRYELIMSLVPWPVAQNYCSVIYTDLATILSDTDWLRVTSVSKSKRLTTDAWVGLYNDVNSWRWSLDDVPLKNVTYTFWQPGEPNNYLGKQSCVMAWEYGYWSDIECTLLRPYICYNGEFIFICLVLVFLFHHLITLNSTIVLLFQS